MQSYPPKKNTTIEVRLADTTKNAFADRCRHDGMTASDAIRGFIDAQLAGRSRRGRQAGQHWRLLIAVLVGSGLGAGIAAPSFARSAPPTQAAFERLDRDHDRRLTYEEFRAR